MKKNKRMKLTSLMDFELNQRELQNVTGGCNAHCSCGKDTKLLYKSLENDPLYTGGCNDPGYHGMFPGPLPVEEDPITKD